MVNQPIGNHGLGIFCCGQIIFPPFLAAILNLCKMQKTCLPQKRSDIDIARTCREHVVKYNFFCPKSFSHHF